jgi:hypothetical protein
VSTKTGFKCRTLKVNSGSEQLQILGNNLSQRLKLGRSCQLHGEKGLEGTTFHNAYTQKGNNSTKSLAYTTLVCPIFEYGAACWDPYREGQIYASDRVQKKAAKFAYHMSESNWKTLSQRRKIARICTLFKEYSGERAWKFIGDRLQRPNYLSRIDHDWKIRNNWQRTDIGKYFFVNRTIRLWNRLPAEILGTLPCKPSAFRKRVRKVINVVN